MLEELLRQINEAVESGRDLHSQRAAVNIIVGNGNTVVIGNDNGRGPEGVPAHQGSGKVHALLLGRDGGLTAYSSCPCCGFTGDSCS